MYDFMEIIVLKAVFSADRSGVLPPYLGSTLRGILGHCFREFICHTPEVKCFCCEKRDNCSYVAHFCNTGGEGGAINPFALYSLTEGKTQWEIGDECSFQITLFGRAAASPGIYLDALMAMQRKGWGVRRIPFHLKRITEGDTGQLIYAGGRTWLRNLRPHFMRIEPKAPRMALVAFDTPVRIDLGGQLFSELPFQTLIHFLARRFSLMTQVHTDFTLEWDLERLLQKASGIKTVDQEWRRIDFSRYSMNHKGNKLVLPGRKGWVLYEGDLRDFVPVLEAGRYLQAGKNTTIGFGHYEVFYDEEVVNGEQ